MYLRQPAIAQLVVESIRKGVQLGHYELYAYVVMGNHVHVLIDPHIHPSRLLKSLKGATAREANKLVGRTGEPFWHKESYDDWVRDQAEFGRIRLYIENNPVKAGLVKLPHDYPWSSASIAVPKPWRTHSCVPRRHSSRRHTVFSNSPLWRTHSCVPHRHSSRRHTVFSNWPLWRTHSCVPRRDSSRRHALFSNHQ